MDLSPPHEKPVAAPFSFYARWFGLELTDALFFRVRFFPAYDQQTKCTWKKNSHAFFLLHSAYTSPDQRF